MTAAGSANCGDRWTRWVRYYGENGDELQLPFNFRLMQQPWERKAMRASVDEMEAALPASAWPNYVLGNHDQPRLASRFGGLAQARLAGMMLLTLRGTPTVYYGDEIGLENGVIPLEKISDPQGINLGAERSRDVCRTPMQWDASAERRVLHRGTLAAGHDDYKTRNVAVQSDDQSSMLSFYRKLFWQRRASAALFGGDYRPLDVDGDCFVYVRTFGREKKLVALNFSAQPMTVNTGLAGNARSGAFDPSRCAKCCRPRLDPSTPLRGRDPGYARVTGCYWKVLAQTARLNPDW